VPCRHWHGARVDRGSEVHGAIPQHLYRYWRSEVHRRHDRWNDLKSASPAEPDGAAEPLATKPIVLPWNFMFTLQWTVASMRGRYMLGGTT